MKINDITERVIGGAIEVHRELGPGLLESAYEECLAHLLTSRGMRVERQVPMPVVFRGKRLACGYRLDMLVEGAVVVEVKTVSRIERIHVSQTLTYLRLSERRVGLLINFNVDVLKHGLRRVVYDYQDDSSASSGPSVSSASLVSPPPDVDPPPDAGPDASQAPDVS